MTEQPVDTQPPTSDDKDKKKDGLPMPWDNIHGAIWLIGLAILFWQGWWWPGILVLAAISALAEGGMRMYLNRQEQAEQITAKRRAALPDACPKCGSPINADNVKWSGPASANCPYCGSPITGKPA